MENAKNKYGTDEPETFDLSESFSKIVTELLEVTNRYGFEYITDSKCESIW